MIFFEETQKILKGICSKIFHFKFLQLRDFI